MNDNIFQATMTGLETGLQVQHIATWDDELRTCDIDDGDAATLFADPQFEDFDNIPVRKNGFIIGVITRECEGSIKQCLQPLTETMLIAAQEPLTQFISLMANRPPYRLVIRSGHISGIVTRSDLLKLPVRLFAFTLVTHLELLMIDIIRASYPEYLNEPQWLKYLDEDRQKKVRDKQHELKQGNYDLPLLECTEFCDKRDIVRKIYSLSNKFKTDLERIERYVRNTVAHAASYARNDQEMESFIQLIGLIRTWISRLESPQHQ